MSWEVVVVLVILLALGPVAGPCIAALVRLDRLRKDVEVRGERYLEEQRERVRRAREEARLLAGQRRHVGELLRDLARVRARVGALHPGGVSIREAYPELGYGHGLDPFLNRLERHEEALATLRSDYRQAVCRYHGALGRFPGSLMAHLFSLPRSSISLPETVWDFRGLV